METKVLRALQVYGPMTVQQLSKHCQTSRAAIRFNLFALVNKNLVVDLGNDMYGATS